MHHRDNSCNSHTNGQLGVQVFYSMRDHRTFNTEGGGAAAFQYQNVTFGQIGWFVRECADADPESNLLLPSRGGTLVDIFLLRNVSTLPDSAGLTVLIFSAAGVQLKSRIRRFCVLVVHLGPDANHIQIDTVKCSHGDLYTLLDICCRVHECGLFELDFFLDFDDAAGCRCISISALSLERKKRQRRFRSFDSDSLCVPNESESASHANSARRLEEIQFRSTQHF